MLEEPLFDGMWIAKMVNHFGSLFAKLAVIGGNGSSNTCETAIRGLRELNKVLSKTEQPTGSIDSKKFARFFGLIHVIKLWFKIGNYK